MRDRKGSVYDGGIRVPFFIRWAGQLKAGREVEQIAAHIDLGPTLLEACAVPKPANVAFDGVSLWPLLIGARAQWPERMLYFQWHRGDVPELHRAFAARSARFKLVQAGGAGEKWAGKKVFELLDMQSDPGEQHDLSAERPELMKQMLVGYERWFDNMKASRNFASPRIVVGTTNENPVTLTRQDWRGPNASWSTNGLGYWDIDVARTGRYDVQMLFPRLTAAAVVHFRSQDQDKRRALDVGSDKYEFSDIHLQKGPARIEAWLETEATQCGVHYVFVGAKLGKEPH